MSSTSTYPPRVVVMGVSGCGKSTVGALIAGILGVPFIEADDLQPPRNLAKIASGTPLTDMDRWPWLRAVADQLVEPPDGAVVACSALQSHYRDILRRSAPGTVFVHLAGAPRQIAARLESSPGHLMPPSLLHSQFVALQPLRTDEVGLTLDITSPPAQLAEHAAGWVRRHHGPAVVPQRRRSLRG